MINGLLSLLLMLCLVLRFGLVRENVFSLQVKPEEDSVTRTSKSKLFLLVNIYLDYLTNYLRVVYFTENGSSLRLPLTRKLKDHFLFEVFFILSKH